MLITVIARTHSSSFASMKSSKIGQTKASDSPITSLSGQCHCGAISYIAPLPPTIEETSVLGYDFKANCVVPPSEQKYPNRGSRPDSNRWKATHCHCNACRRTIGAFCADWLDVPRGKAVITRKGPTGKYRASNRATREFVNPPSRSSD